MLSCEFARTVQSPPAPPASIDEPVPPDPAEPEFEVPALDASDEVVRSLAGKLSRAGDGVPLLATGTPGGRTIINTTMQTILNVIDHEMNVARAISAPRIHHQWLPDSTSMEADRISMPQPVVKIRQAWIRHWTWHGLL